MGSHASISGKGTRPELAFIATVSKLSGTKAAAAVAASVRAGTEEQETQFLKRTETRAPYSLAPTRRALVLQLSHWIALNGTGKKSAGKYGDRHIRPSPFPAILRIWRCCWNQPSRLLLRLIKVPAAPVRSAGSGCKSWLLVQVPQSVLNRDQYVCKQVQFIHALGVA